MSALALVVTIYYVVIGLALILLFGFWMITRKKEDDIWRWILSLIGGLIFSTVFWIAYWLGSHGAWQLIPLFVVGIIIWLWIFFSHSTQSKLDKSVFAAFGVIALGMIMFGGYTSGGRDWWFMSIPLYIIGIQMLHHMFVPD